MKIYYHISLDVITVDMLTVILNHKFESILNTAALVVTCYCLTKINANETIFTIALLIFISMYVIIASIPKNFENEAKKKLLPYLLKNIIKEDGDIKWQGSQFEFEEISPEEKIIDKLEDEINKRCNKSNKTDDKLDKYLDYLSESEELEKKRNT